MKTYYECHITMTGKPEEIKPVVDATGWKFSAILGDIVLGDGLKCYATRHYNTRIAEDEMVKILHETADVITNKGIEVIRRKVERVLYDDRSYKVRPEEKCNGACIGCHLDDYEPQAEGASK